MRLPRFRLRTLMLAVAATALVFAAALEATRLAELSRTYAREAAIHGMEAGYAGNGAEVCDKQAALDRATAKSDPDPWFSHRARWATEQAAWYRQHARRRERLAALYEAAARRPWIAIPPEPPEPAPPAQPE